MILSGIKADDQDYYQTIEYRAKQGIPIALFVLFPLSLIRDMNGLRHISVISILAIVYAGIILLI
jgi:hypothetical protein